MSTQDWTETLTDAVKTEFQNEASDGIFRNSFGEPIGKVHDGSERRETIYKTSSRPMVFAPEETKYISPLIDKLDKENQNLLGKIDRLNKQRIVTVARLENQRLNLKAVREAVGQCNEGGNKLAAALIESMQREVEILEHELRNFS